MKKIFSKNADYQKFTVLRTNRNKRHRYNEFLVEGVRNINEAIRNGWRIKSFIYSYEKSLSLWAEGLLKTVKTEINYELTDSLMSGLSDKEDTSELLAVVEMKNANEFKAKYLNPVIMLFDRPSNKGNLGTIIRSCDSFGAEELVITGHAVDIYDPDVISSSMGSFFKLPFRILSDNAQIDEFVSGLRRKYPGLKVIGTTAHHETDIFMVDMTSPVLLLIGNETDGLNRHLKEEVCDVMATIPMSEQSSASSLNVSCAATVMLYEASRQRLSRGAK